MSSPTHIDYAELTRQSRQITDAKRIIQMNAESTENSDSQAGGGKSGSAEPAKNRHRFQRSKSGCWVCRRSKVKCDETRPSCLRCAAGRKECIYPTISSRDGRSTSNEVDSDRRQPSSARRPAKGGMRSSASPQRDTKPSLKEREGGVGNGNGHGNGTVRGRDAGGNGNGNGNSGPGPSVSAYRSTVDSELASSGYQNQMQGISPTNAIAGPSRQHQPPQQAPSHFQTFSTFTNNNSRNDAGNQPRVHFDHPSASSNHRGSYPPNTFQPQQVLQSFGPVGVSNDFAYALPPMQTRPPTETSPMDMNLGGNYPPQSASWAVRTPSESHSVTTPDGALASGGSRESMTAFTSSTYGPPTQAASNGMIPQHIIQSFRPKTRPSVVAEGMHLPAFNQPITSPPVPLDTGELYPQQGGTLYSGDLSRSLLITKRAQKSRETDGPMGVVGNPSGSLVNPAITALANMAMVQSGDRLLFEFGPSDRSLRTNVPPMETAYPLNNPSGSGFPLLSVPPSIDFLSNAFPSPLGRQLLHHYVTQTARIVVAIGTGPNPFTTLFAPLTLMNTASPASAALRMSMLSASVAHLQFLIQSGQPIGRPPDPAAIEQMKVLEELGAKFKTAALTNLLFCAGTDGTPERDDSLLAACVMLLHRDVLNADPTWKENLEFGLAVIRKRGGPQVMLAEKSATYSRRFLLENIATHDVFAAFTTGKEPTLLGAWAPWWFESVETSTNRWEWESVERNFGMSRAMIDLVARIKALDALLRRLELSLAPNAAKAEMSEVRQHFVREANCLLEELDIWGNSLNSLPQHHRVNCGDHIYRYSMVIFVMSEILHHPTTHPRIVAAVSYVLELCGEASSHRMCVMLVWPLVIAGGSCLVESRGLVGSIFDAFSLQYCNDLDAARKLVEAQWERIDMGLPPRAWCDLMIDMDNIVLLI